MKIGWHTVLLSANLSEGICLRKMRQTTPNLSQAARAALGRAVRCGRMHLAWALHHNAGLHQRCNAKAHCTLRPSATEIQPSRSGTACMARQAPPRLRRPGLPRPPTLAAILARCGDLGDGVRSAALRAEHARHPAFRPKNPLQQRRHIKIGIQPRPRPKPGRADADIRQMLRASARQPLDQPRREGGDAGVQYHRHARAPTVVARRSSAAVPNSSINLLRLRREPPRVASNAVSCLRAGGSTRSPCQRLQEFRRCDVSRPTLSIAGSTKQLQSNP